MNESSPIRKTLIFQNHTPMFMEILVSPLSGKAAYPGDDLYYMDSSANWLIFVYKRDKQISKNVWEYRFFKIELPDMSSEFT